MSAPGSGSLGPGEVGCSGTVFIHLGCCTTVQYAGWFINNRNGFPPIPEAGSQITAQAGSGSGDGLLPGL